ncbi:MAG TPA: hypothetical protein VF166_04200 [Gemmatimonadaceae bacterium]
MSARGRVVLPAVMVLCTACGATMWPPLDTTSQASVPAAVSCAKDAAQSLGYKIVRSAPDLFEGQRTDTTARLKLDEFTRYDDLSVSATGASSGSKLHIVPGTVSVRVTRAGRFEDHNPASAAVQQDAKVVAQKCGS